MTSFSYPYRRDPQTGLTTAVVKTFADWLNVVDACSDYDWRRDASQHYSWQAAYDDGMSPQEAIDDCRAWLEQ